MGGHPSDGMVSKNPQKHPSERPTECDTGSQSMSGKKFLAPPLLWCFLRSPYTLTSPWTLERVRIASWTLSRRTGLQQTVMGKRSLSLKLKDF